MVAPWSHHHHDDWHVRCKVYEVQFDEGAMEVSMDVLVYLYFIVFFVFVSLYLYHRIWWRHDGGNGAGITCFLEPRRVAATDQTWRHLVQVDKCTAQTSAECECAQASVQIQMYKYKYKYRPEAI